MALDYSYAMPRKPKSRLKMCQNKVECIWCAIKGVVRRRFLWSALCDFDALKRRNFVRQCPTVERRVLMTEFEDIEEPATTPTRVSNAPGNGLTANQERFASVLGDSLSAIWQQTQSSTSQHRSERIPSSAPASR